MAHTWVTRTQAQNLYVQGGLSYAEIQARLGIGTTTLKRWGRDGEWAKFRDRAESIATTASDLLLSVLTAAKESADPQQIFAAHNLGEALGVFGDSGPRNPSPKKVASVLLDALAHHHEIGPVIRKYRNEVIRITLQELDKMPAEGTP